MSETAQQVKPVNFAYVGCGFVAQTIHIPNFSALPNCRFAALAEARPELGQEVAARYGIPKVYTSHEEIAADPEIEAVGVSAPYALQGRIAEDLVRAGKHVFMEKPMAVSTARAESIVEAVRSGAARLMVGYMKRYDTGNILLKGYVDEWLQTGAMGRFLLARNHGFGGNWVYGQDPNIPMSHSASSAPPAPDECPEWLPPQWRNAYLGYLQQWTHNVNLLRFFLGDTEGNTRVVSVQLDQDGMTGIVVLEINGKRAVVESGYTQFHGWEEHTQLYFQKGWLRTQAPAIMQKEKPATVEIYRASADGRAPQLMEEFPAPAWSYREEAKHFLHCIQTGEPFHSSAEDTLHDVRLFEEIYRQFVAQQ
ncbi:MAG: Gfo/Idh/MocA family oxidoreductase [Abitibacteriaceae bacterium]|nr:Gfo/Idh/MocA family oxidoreductase [Abditibacteriaceae bacterium]